MPVDADFNCTVVVTPSCELKGLRTWKDICLVRNSLFQHQEALKKKQQPPTTTPSPVSSSFVPAPVPTPVPATPLAAAAPTVPALPAQTHTQTDVRPLYI
ncbi:unnamed protein product [Pieris macdunnoughi]|uniref:Uncharacterized protein n=1 Tax=Pieris macdunnoughi TaxID=345717 RepID=A0A821Q5Q4_9NEOP|nr:unnamed protein product [Pieris macdunnoughi]